MAKKNSEWKIIFPDGEFEKDSLGGIAKTFAKDFQEVTEILRERYGDIAGIKVQKVGGKRK